MIEIRRKSEFKKTFEREEETEEDFKKSVLDRYERIRSKVEEMSKHEDVDNK